jgi:hypothetical protein
VLADVEVGRPGLVDLLDAFARTAEALAALVGVAEVALFLFRRPVLLLGAR